MGEEGGDVGGGLEVREEGGKVEWEGTGELVEDVAEAVDCVNG